MPCKSQPEEAYVGLTDYINFSTETFDKLKKKSNSNINDGFISN